MDDGFQAGAQRWVVDCFGPEVAADPSERLRRFLEEGLELAQSLGATPELVAQIAAYVFARAPGAPGQEVGGTLMTLAALCSAHGLDMMAEGRAELARIDRPEVITAIRAKHAAKPRF